MEILILHGGVEIGPFSEVTAQTLLKQGSVLVTDMAWTPGMAEWIPLVNLLYSHSAPLVAAEVHLPTPTPFEPATAKQKAFLSYMGMPFDSDISKEKASQQVNEVMENPRDGARLARWNVDRLRLHPDLFSEEIQARKEGRPQRFLEICEKDGAEYFTKITKAHCQVLVSYLDVKFPNWDAEDQDAATSYFFPAVAEKFPQLLTRAAKGRFKYSTGQKIAREHASHSPVAVKARRSSSKPFAALARGAFFGALILGMLWFVKGTMDAQKKGSSDGVNKTPTSQNQADSSPVAVAVSKPATPPPATVTAQAPVTAQTVPKVPNAFDPAALPEPGGTSSQTPPPANTAPPGPVAAPSSNTIPLFTPDPVPGSGLAAATAPLSQLIPGGPRNLTLTKAIEAQARYGKVKLPAGTTVKLVQRTGQTVKVLYLNDTFLIPASSTDIGNDPGPLPTAAPNTQVSVAAPAAVPLSPASDL
ncbi:MAG TPA: GYF domain-containing protein [Chthoniobacteraceae bacterium]|nr:GYF domain-containing protein [Chthoniobacteraceae bacterium]